MYGTTTYANEFSEVEEFLTTVVLDERWNKYSHIHQKPQQLQIKHHKINK